MNPHFFTAPFYFAFIWFKVQGSRGGFAAIICGAMPDQESFSPLPLEGGRRAKRGGVGIPAGENIASRSQPPPLRGTFFQRKEGEKRSALTGN